MATTDKPLDEDDVEFYNLPDSEGIEDPYLQGVWDQVVNEWEDEDLEDEENEEDEEDEEEEDPDDLELGDLSQHAEGGPADAIPFPKETPSVG